MCGRSYSQSGNLNVHLKTIHGVEEGWVGPTGQTRARTEPEVARPHKCYICNRLFTTSSNMYQHIRVVHNIMIETSKSSRLGPVPFPSPGSVAGGGTGVPFPSPGGGNGGGQPLGPSKSASQLDHWAQVQLNELKSLSSAEQSLPPSPKVVQGSAGVSRVGGTFSGKVLQEPTILDTLQQLSALAGGGGKSSKKKQANLHLMDQNKPITPNEGDVTRIKQEKE